MDAAIAAVLLTALLALAELGPVRAAFDAIALGLAVAAAPLLDAIGLAVSRTGAELRGVAGNWAVAVTEVCDGHGLVAAWLALISAMRTSRHGLLMAGIVGCAAIQIFNLFRVVILAVVLAAWPGGFEAVHLYLFPLLTVALFSVLVWQSAQVSGRVLVAALGAGTVLAALWAVVGAIFSGLVLVPPANAVLALLEPAGIDAIVPSSGGWAVATERLASLEPPAFLQAPIHPEDFAIALPALAAAAIAARRGATAVAAALALMIVALALGATTAGWGLSGDGTPGLVVRPLPAGGVEVTPYQPAGETAEGLVRLAQNGIVHFNLLVLPLLILMARGTPPAKATA